MATKKKPDLPEGSTLLISGVAKQQQYQIGYDPGGLNIHDPTKQDPPTIIVIDGDKIRKIKIEDLLGKA